MVYQLPVIGGYVLNWSPESLVWHGPNDIIEERLSNRGVSQLFNGAVQADVITFDGWVNSADLSNLMTLRDKRRIITFKSDIIGKYFTNPILFAYVEDVILNEQRGFLTAYPYKFRLRKVADYDNFNRNTIFNATTEVSTFALTPKTVMTYPLLDGAVVYAGASSQYSLLTSPSSALNLTGSTTFEIFVNPTNFSALRTLIAKGNNGGTQINFEIDINTSGFVVFKYTSAAGVTTHTYTTTSQALTAGAWNSIQVSYTFGTGSTMQIFVNGGVLTTNGLTATAATGSWTAGTGNSAPDTGSQRLVAACNSALAQFFTGSLSNIGIRNVLAATDGSDALKSFYRTTPLLDTNTVALWQLSEWIGTVNYDSSGNNNKLTMTNTPTFGKGQSTIQPSQLPSGVRNAENGGMPYINNPNGSSINYHTTDYDLDFNNVVTGQTSGELWIKNGLVKLQTRTQQGSNQGAIDVYYWNGTTYNYVGFFYHSVYNSTWENTSGQVANPSFIINDDTEYASLQVIWNGFSDGVTVMCEYEVYKGKPYFGCRLTNIGIPNINAYNTIISNTQLSSLVNWNQEAVNMTPGGAGVPQSLLATAITKDASATGNTAGAAAATVTATLTNVANTLIVAAVGIRNGTSQTVSKIVHDAAGQNMAFTKLGTLVNGTEEDLEFWYLWQPNALSAKVVTCTFSANAEASMVVVSLLGTNAALNNAVTAIGTGAAGTLVLVANKPVASQVTLPVSQTITSIGVNWNAVVAGNVIVSLYSDNAGAPGTLLTQSAVVAQGATGWQDIAVPSYYAQAGLYWIAISSSTGSTLNNLAATGLRSVYNAANASLIFDTTWGTATGSANQLQLRGWQTSPSNLIFETAIEPTQTAAAGATATAVSLTVNPYDHLAGRWILMCTVAKGVAAGTPTIAIGASQTDIGTTQGTDATPANTVRTDLNSQASDPSTVVTATLSTASTFAAMAITVIPQIMILANNDTNNFTFIASANPIALGTTVVYIFTRTKANDRYYIATQNGTYWTAIGQHYGIVTTPIATSNDFERFYIGFRLMETALGGDDDPSSLGTEILSTVDMTQDVIRVT